jgi:hypothetical protein
MVNDSQMPSSEGGQSGVMCFTDRLLGRRGAQTDAVQEGAVAHEAYASLRASFEQDAWSGAEDDFVKYGGFTYFDSDGNAVATLAVCPEELGTPDSLCFGRPCNFTKRAMHEIEKRGGFQDVTLPYLRDRGATHFAWLGPREFKAHGISAPHGAFAYTFADGVRRYYPVVTIPVFQPDMLERKLSQTEAWVVLIARGHPQLEAPVVFDKSLGLTQNLDRLNRGGLALDTVGICMRRSCQPRDITYFAWQLLDEPGSLSDPWILEQFG